MDRERPLVAVLYEPGAFSALELSEASKGVCRLLWVTDWGGALLPSSTRRLLARLGTVIEAVPTVASTAARLAAAGVDGIAVFTDRAQVLAAALARELGLPFHSPETAHLLTDKLDQRAVLQAAGVPTPAAVAIEPGTGARQIASAAAIVEWPAVLKPRRGTGGRDVLLLNRAGELADALAGARREEEFILETYLPDRTPRAEQLSADLMSVELVASGGRMQPLALSGRAPLAPPMREGGGHLPSELNGLDAAQAIEAALAGAAAVGASHGVLHIELKMTPDGPRIIEINGRVGGVVPSLLQRIDGPPIITWALRLALGDDPGPVGPVPRAPVAYYHTWVPPVGQYRITAVDGIEDVMALAEVDRVWLNRRVGDIVGSLEGSTEGYLAAALGTAPDHETVWSVTRRLESLLRFTLEPLE